jgi:hypothetical protein
MGSLPRVAAGTAAAGLRAPLRALAATAPPFFTNDMEAEAEGEGGGEERRGAADG